MKEADLQDTREEVKKLMANQDELAILYSSAERMIRSLKPRAKREFGGNDVANRVLIALYHGSRTWDRKKFPVLKDFIYSRLLLSEIRNMLDHDKKLVREGEERIGDCDGGDGEEVYGKNELSDAAPFSPDYEGELDRKMMIDEAERDLESDEKRFFVFQGMMEGKSVQEIADANKYSVPDVRNEVRNVRRTLDRKFKEQRESISDPKKFRKLTKNAYEESDSEIGGQNTET
ncbi:MAG TPA: hypothetical protein VLX91_17115 [Candidatus Acidoferrales bacterium]|nr:hypothetical protein [Candidatus Acidoferrales bacterium]